MNKSDSIGKLAKALAQFQAEVKQPFKDSENPFFKSKFVPLESVVEAITNIAPKFGLSFIQYAVNNENKVGVITVILHDSGEYIESEPIYALPGKQDAQGAGAVITYLKRYSLSAMFGITSDKDDDGEQARKDSIEQVSLPQLLKDKSIKLGLGQADLYKEVSESLGIFKNTKDLTEKEKLALISVLNKK